MPNSDIILCACGCGNPVKKAKYPSLQRRFINTHQHKGENNGNYRGGKDTLCCPVCGKSFQEHKSQKRVTCSHECGLVWQKLTTSARGQNKVTVKCAYCGKELKLFPSQVHEVNFCNRFCLAKAYPKNGMNNGRWSGGTTQFFRRQTMIRDNYKCVICGFDAVVDVHHITSRANGGTNDFSNLITLCPNHHKMADLGLIDVEHLRNTTWTPDFPYEATKPPSPNRKMKELRK